MWAWTCMRSSAMRALAGFGEELCEGVGRYALHNGGGGDCSNDQGS